MKSLLSLLQVIALDRNGRAIEVGDKIYSSEEARQTRYTVAKVYNGHVILVGYPASIWESNRFVLDK
jgi:transcription elongation factor